MDVRLLLHQQRSYGHDVGPPRLSAKPAAHACSARSSPWIAAGSSRNTAL